MIKLGWMGSISVEFVVERERRNIREQRGKVEMVRAVRKKLGRRKMGIYCIGKKINITRKQRKQRDTLRLTCSVSSCYLERKGSSSGYFTKRVVCMCGRYRERHWMSGWGPSGWTLFMSCQSANTVSHSEQQALKMRHGNLFSFLVPLHFITHMIPMLASPSFLVYTVTFFPFFPSE